MGKASRKKAERQGFDIPVEPQGQAPKKHRNEAQEKEHFVLTFMYALTAPTILHPDWMDSFRDGQAVKDIKLHRLAHLMESMEKEEACDYEAMLYCSSASLAAPFTHEAANVYLYLFTKAMPKAILDAQPDLRPDGKVNMEAVRDLKRWIFKQQMEVVKSRMAGEKKGEQEAEAEEKAKEPKILRASFFDQEEAA